MGQMSAKPGEATPQSHSLATKPREANPSTSPRRSLHSNVYAPNLLKQSSGDIPNARGAVSTLAEPRTAGLTMLPLRAGLNSTFGAQISWERLLITCRAGSFMSDVFPSEADAETHIRRGPASSGTQLAQMDLSMRGAISSRQIAPTD